MTLKRSSNAFWQCFDCPLGAFSVMVRDVLELAEPVEVASVQGSRCNVSLKHALFQTNVPVLQNTIRLVSPEGTQVSLRDALQQWGLPADLALQDVPCMWVPDVILKLLLRRRWSSLVLRMSSHAMQKHHGIALRWFTNILQWPSPEDMTRMSACAKSQVDPPTHSLDPADAHFLLLEVRKHASTMIAESHDPDTTQLKLEQAAEGLQVFQLAFQKSHGGSRNEARADYRRTAEHLIRVISAAQHLRNKSKMGELQES